MTSSRGAGRQKILTYIKLGNKTKGYFSQRKQYPYMDPSKNLGKRPGDQRRLRQLLSWELASDAGPDTHFLSQKKQIQRTHIKFSAAESERSRAIKSAGILCVTTKYSVAVIVVVVVVAVVRCVVPSALVSCQRSTLPDCPSST